MRKEITVCCAAKVIRPGRHSKEDPQCSGCGKAVKKLNPVRSGVWIKPY